MTTTTASFYVKRTYADFFGNVDHVDYVGPYMESQEFAVKMQEGADRRRMKPAKVQITRWEWVQGKDS
jgi:hypothetical protein